MKEKFKLTKVVRYVVEKKKYGIWGDSKKYVFLFSEFGGKLCNEILSSKTNRYYYACCLPNTKSKIKTLNKYISQNKETIPKIIHQIWIGPKKIPYKWINTFKIDFRKKFPGWKHYLWTDKNVKNLKLKNIKAYEAEKTYNGKSDILRYELLYKFGGIYIDADTSWLGTQDLENLIKETNNSGFFTAKECNFANKCGLASGVVGSTKNNLITKHLVNIIHDNYFKCYKKGDAYKTIGPYFLDQALEGLNITIFPYNYFYPIYWFSKDANSMSIKEISKEFPKSYMTQHGYTTNQLHDLISFKSVWKNDKKGYDDAILILKYFNNFCNKYGIKFSLIFGTLLGYVRHNGFIPWDDDMDVTVENKKFNKYYLLLNNDQFKIIKYKGFYKLFLRKNKSIGEYAWSWPFLDIFPYFQENNQILIPSPSLQKNSAYEYKFNDFYPLKIRKYENIYLPVPNNSQQILNVNYGKNWKNVCKSGLWVHKTEKPKIEKTLPCHIIEKYNYLI